MKNLINQILIFLAQNILKKFRSQYRKISQSDLLTILVAGNIGKSSQTLLLNQSFKSLDYLVWSGTSQNKNRNTLTGLIMTLGEFEYNLEQGNIIQKIGFIFKVIQVWAFKTWNFGSTPNILIYEIGVDRLGEMDDYITVFQDIDWVVLSNFGPEHTVGFPSDFKLTNFNQSKKVLADLYNLSPEFNLSLDSSTKPISGILKNCYFEQLKLLTIAKNYILPASFELSGFKLLLKKDKKLEIIELSPIRQANQTILNSGFWTPSEYLLPKSFVRQIAMTQIIAQNFGLSNHKLQQTLDALVLPNGRFGFFDGLNQTKIVDGSYNSDPASLDSFLKLLVEIQANEPSYMLNYLVLGEMRELGDSSIEAHQKILKQVIGISKILNIKVILLGSTWLACDFSELPDLFQHFKKVGDIIAYFRVEPVPTKSWFWIKGSQNTIFLESLVESLLAKESDKSKLARRGKDWDLLRENWL